MNDAQAAVRILAVEDSEGDLELLRYTLRQVRGERFELTNAKTLMAGLETMSGGPYDVVMLDLNLPDSHGMETVQQTLAAADTLPVIVFTGVEDEGLGVEAVRLGAQDYLVKGESNGWAMWRSIHYAVERKQAAERLRALNETLEQRVAERTSEVRQRSRQLQLAAGELAQAEQRERNRLAMALHDHLQQLLVGLKLRLRVAHARSSDPAAREPLEKMDGLLDESLEATRSLVLELSPPILRQADLPAAMNWLAEWIRDKHDLKVDVLIQEGAEVHSAEVRAFLLQAVRELLFNVVKHAGVDRATLEILQQDEYLWARVTDQGAGFEVQPRRIPPSSNGAGFGLANIRDRVELMGGCMDIRSAPGQGTRMTVVVPIDLPLPVSSQEVPQNHG